MPRQLKRRLKERRAPCAVGASLATVVGLWLLFGSTGQTDPLLTRLSYDLPFSLRPDVAVDGAVLVYMDELSHSDLKQPFDAPWDRNLHARLLRQLAGCGAKAVVFDLLLTESGRDPAADAALAKAIRDHGRVVLGCNATPDETLAAGAEIRAQKPLPMFVEAAAGYGFVDFPHGPDDAIREHINGWSDLPSLSWELATVLGAPVTKDTAQADRRRWINFYGPPDHLPHMSYFQAITDPTTAARFRDKVVFVGHGRKVGFSGKRQDLFPTPFYWSKERRAPGPEIHATMYLNLVRGDWLEEMNLWLEFGLVLACGLVSGIGLALCRPLPATLAAVAGELMFFGLGNFLPWLSHVWFAWLVPCLAQIPLALFCSLVFIAQKRALAIAADETIDHESATEQGSGHLAIADHELVRSVGSGSYGQVWLAHNVTGALRAVKIIQRGSFNDARQFEREFEGVRKFEPISRLHEGLVDILHVGRDAAGGYFYYVMELADDAGTPKGDGVTECWNEGKTATVAVTQDHASSPGYHPPAADRYIARTLRLHLQQRGMLPIEECLRLGVALTSALDFLHRYGLVHRDIKPSNIIFVQGQPKLADIGLVTEAGEARTFVGTEGYIPPEGPGTAQADLYALGKVLYECVTGLEVRRFPELASTTTGESERKARLHFYELALKACAPDPARRFVSAAAMQGEMMVLARGR